MYLTSFTTSNLISIVISFIGSVALSFLFAPVAVWAAEKLNAIDVPGRAAHKRHSVPTPLAGGLVFFVSFPILFVSFSLWKEITLVWVFAGTLVIFLFGMLDDIFGFSAPQKFSGQFVATIILISSGISVRFIENANLPLAEPVITLLNWALTLFWVVGITNAFNLIDSMDGLVAGLTIVSAGFFTFISLASGQVMLAELSAMLFGLSIGLYYYNRTPARFFLGDSGAQVIGFLFAAIGILYRPPDISPGSTWFMPILLLGIPIFDTSMVVISRLRRHKHLFQADQAHTFHRLVQLGFSSGHAVLIMQAASLILCVLAFIAMFLPPYFAMMIFFVLVLIGSRLIIFFERVAGIKG